MTDVSTTAGQDGSSGDRAGVPLASEPSERRTKLMAMVANDSVVRGATTGLEYASSMFGHDLALMTYTPEVRKQTDAVKRGDMSGVEAMLVVQANTLDLMFNQLALKSAQCDHMAKMEGYLRLALKAQSQCRTTLEALAEIKNPRPVAFVKQANITSGNQQVNNGPAMQGTAPIATTTRACAREGEKSGATNELLEHHDGEWLDTGTAGEAGRSNQALEAVGAVDRAED